MSTDRPEGRSKTKYMGTSQNKSCKTCTSATTLFYMVRINSRAHSMCLPTHKRQPPRRIYGPAPFTEAAGPGSSCPARPLLSPSAPRGGSSFCRMIPQALMPQDKKLLLLLSSVPACPGFQLAGQVLHPTPSSG